jgi:hypothetical protein
MRRMLTAAASVVFVLGVAAPAASASTAPVTQVIKVTAVQNSSSFHGMSFSFTETLWQSGKKVGNDAVTCRFTSPSPTAIGHCTGVLIFTGSGDLFVKAMTEATSNGAHGRVVGGTGVFTNAEGTLLVVNPSRTSHVSHITLTFHV